MVTVRRFCYKHQRRMVHEMGYGSRGELTLTCVECGHVNESWTEDWRIKYGRQSRGSRYELGATLRRKVA